MHQCPAGIELLYVSFFCVKHQNESLAESVFLHFYNSSRYFHKGPHWEFFILVLVSKGNLS